MSDLDEASGASSTATATQDRVCLLFFWVFLLIFFIFFQENLKKFEFEHKEDGDKEKESMHEWEKDAKKWLDEQILHSPSIPPV